MAWQSSGPEQDWRLQAACRGGLQHLFYSPHTCQGPECSERCKFRSEPGRMERMRKARALCWGDPETGTSECPVRLDCLAYALDNGIKQGTWGGYSERERRDVVIVEIRGVRKDVFYRHSRERNHHKI